MGEETSGSSLTSRPLEHESYYHGLLPRDDVQQILKKDGDFVVRVAEHQGKLTTIISVMKGGPRHFVVNKSREGHFYLEKKAFESINDLIRYHLATKEPLTAKSRAQLLNPVPKQSWEISHDQIKLEKKIGEGAFGIVYKGTLNIPHRKQEVAIKTCRDNPTQAERIKFMKEARIMRSYDHPNIIRLYGVAAQQAPLMLVLEYGAGGSLLDYLKRSGSASTPSQKINFCLDAAKGMEYLEARKCIHRDLAARNCLLGKHNEVKVSDFGLSRNQEVYTNKKEKKLPVKWMAPETLTESTYSSKSDIWSYAILVWEIFSNGTPPYEGMSNIEVLQKVCSEKYRMKSPDRTPPPIAQLMNRSWEQNPDRRPTFAQIKQELERRSLKSHR